MNELRTHWIWVTSARRCVIIAGTATFTEPIITEFVSEPRIIDRLMAQRAEDTVTPGISAVLAEAEEATCLAGERGGLGTCGSFLLQLCATVLATSSGNGSTERPF